VSVPATIIAIILAVTSLFAAGSTARAHATLISSDPVDGTVIEAPPRGLSLTFNEPVTPLALRLIDAKGKATTLDNPSGRGETIRITSLPDMGRGTHLLSWRVVSLDGHPVGGSITFSIGAPSVGQVLHEADAGDSAGLVALWAAKVVVYIALFFGVGSAFFFAWIAVPATPRADKITATALAAGLIATPLTVGLQGVDALSLPLSGLVNQAVWIAGLETTYGLTAIAIAFSLLSGIFSLQATSPRAARAFSLMGLFGVGLALALSGHASSVNPQWLMRSAVFLHGASVAFWAGCLVPLAAILRRSGSGGLEILGRFSRAIPFAVAILLLSGVLLAVVQLQTPGALWTTYGRVLAAKLTVVVILLGIAARNRFHLTRAVFDGEKKARRHLVRSIWVEIGLVVVIFGLVAIWRFTPPPRAVTPPSTATVHLHTAKAMADVTLASSLAAPARARISLLAGDFGGLNAKEVTLILENKAAGIESIVRPATRNESGVWEVNNLPILVPGRWCVRIDVLISDFEKIMLEGSIDIEH
jgi:copper transport protein